MQLTVIGSSPAWPNPAGANSGYLLEGDGCGPLLLDCGPGVLSRLRAMGQVDVAALAITHLHLDHWGDLVPWAWLIAHSNPPLHRFSVWLPPGALRELELFAHHFGSTDMWSAFELHEYEAETPFEAAGFTVSAVPVEHYDVEAFGFRVADPAGRVLAYSGDSALCPGLERLAADADLFLCEATLADNVVEPAPAGHLTAAQARAVARGRLVLTHRPAELETPPDLERAVEELTFTV